MNSLKSNQPQIVLTFLGGKLPRYAFKNLLRLEEMFPQNEVVLITDTEQSAAIKSTVKLIQIPPVVNSWSQVNQELDHPKEFRNNFWFYTLARFSALATFMESHDKPVLHVECDVLLFPDFPLSEFTLIDTQLAFSVVSKESASAALLYIKNSDAAKNLVKISEQLIRKDSTLTDMRILKYIYDHKIMGVTLLPSFPHEVSNETIFSNLLFDPATWGMYILGVDPRNHRGWSTYASTPPGHQISPNNFFIQGGRDALVVACRCCRIEWKLTTLHIHSKDLRAFELLKNTKYVEFRLARVRGGIYREFKIGVFLSLLLKKLLAYSKD